MNYPYVQLRYQVHISSCTVTWHQRGGTILDSHLLAELFHCECIYLYRRVESCITKSGAVLILGSHRQIVRSGPDGQVTNTGKF